MEGVFDMPGTVLLTPTVSSDIIGCYVAHVEFF